MQIITHRIPGGPHDEVVVAPLGDFQWSGPNGPTALAPLQRHIKKAMKLKAWFLGCGDYTDFMSPSNRQRLKAAGLYDTAEDVVEGKAMDLVQEIYDIALRPTIGRWIGLVEGHHYMGLKDGQTTDSQLARMLKTHFLGTSALIKVVFKARGRSKGKVRLVSSVFYIHHGTGGGTLPSAPLNKLYHTSAGFEGIDAFIMGHTTKSPATRLSKPFPNWAAHDLEHRDVLLINAGGFSKSSIVGHKSGPLPRGDYAEQRMLTPSPLSAPFIFMWPQEGSNRADVRVMI